MVLRISSRALALAAFCVLLSSSLRARAEGSAQVGSNQNLQTDTLIYVDVFSVSEDITWSFGTGGVTITDPGGTQVLNTNTTSGTYNTLTTGTFRVAPKSAQAAAWDIAVTGTSAGFGRVHSPNWHFSTGSFLESAASTTSYYALVPGGLPNTNGVVELKLEGMSGNDYNIGANRTGVNGANAGRSVSSTTGGNTFTPSFEMYLQPPEISTYNPVAPTVTSYTFTAGAQSCKLIIPGTTTGTFKFGTNVDGTYNLVCDLDKDGIFNRVSSTDLLIVGLTTPGTNSVTWDGKDNAGVAVPSGDYNCKVFVNTGELHFVGRDIETSYSGLRLFTVDQLLTHRALTMFWNDTAVQANDVDMPAPTNAPGITTSGAAGIDSGTWATPCTPNVDAHSWGNFTSVSKGNDAFIDTFGSIISSASTVASLRATTSVADADGDLLGDYLESCTLGTDPTKTDTDGDGYSDFVETNGGSPIDTDGDMIIDALDTDSDNDGVPDLTDSNRTNPTICRDLDADGCNDCAITGANLSGGSTTNDGLDTDLDGACNVGDPDDDNDGVPDALDTNPLSASSCADTDMDGCDDCAIVHTGGGSVASDGPDNDGDGLCDLGDPDDDNDGVPDAMDSARTDPNLCRDLDHDTCDDCAVVHTGGGSTSNDGADIDGDGICDAGDTDNDNDGVPDGLDSAPYDASLCRDVDHDTCDDCAIVHTGGGSTSNDGTDTDGDGLCNAGDPDDDNDGVPDAMDSAPLDPSLCRDVDHDTCDDCAIVHTGGGSTSNDGPDADADGICDAGDMDSDNDGVPDAMDSAPSNPHVCRDLDHDTCDDCSITGANHSGGSVSNDGQDTNGDGICDAGSDVDGDGVSDKDDLDIDRDGIPNSAEGSGDSDGDGILDEYDLDSDNDGIPDLIEAGGVDSDGDGRVDTQLDSNHDGLDDALASKPLPRPDTDGDGRKDGLDLDSDGDGLSDIIEAGGGKLDADGDGQIDDTFDDNDNGWDDSVDGGSDLTTPGKPLPIPDTDKDGKPDYRDVDSDADGVLDAIEGHDFNADGKADKAKKGDANHDGLDDAFVGQTKLPNRDKDALADYRDPDDDADGLTSKREIADAKAHPEIGDDPDHDGIPSYLDADSDGDGVDDGTESAGDGDINHDGIPDYLQPNVYPVDSDHDGIPDYIERPGGRDVDTDQDGIPNQLDPDDDGDGIPTKTERPGAKDVDSDGDGKPDYLDPDDDNDGIPTLHELAADGSNTLDTDGDGIPNQLDPDDDGDGIATKDELAANGATQDSDRDGKPDDLDPDDDNDGVPTRKELDANGKPMDTDGDGKPNQLDTDDDDDGLLTKDEIAADGSFLDTDKDGIPNHLDPDDDGDGLPTKNELDAKNQPKDSDGDGIVDHLDPDDDGDGIPTSLEYTPLGKGGSHPISNDIDHDGIPNYLDLDSDGDGIPDAVEAKQDLNKNGIPDYQEPASFGYSGGALCSASRVHAADGSALAWLSIFFLAGVLVRRRRGSRTGA